MAEFTEFNRIGVRTVEARGADGNIVLYTQCSSYSDGSAMDDSKVDGDIYIKVGYEYFKKMPSIEETNVKNPFSEVLFIEFDGTNRVHNLAFTPKYVGYATVNNQNITIFSDYYFEGNKLIFNENSIFFNQLVTPVDLTIVLQYFK